MCKEIRDADNLTTFPLRLERYAEKAEVDCWPLAIDKTVKVP